MSPIARRNLLKLLAASAAGVVAGPARATEMVPNFTNRKSFPPDLPLFGGLQSWGSHTPYKVLEIFLRGGASQWGSFWYDAAEGAETGDTALTDTDWTNLTGVAAPAPGQPTLGAFPTDKSWGGGTIGRAASPLFRSVGVIQAGGGVLYQNLAANMRVIRVGHTLGAHELAIPLAATGSTIGRASQCGLGAAINRRVCQANGTTANPGVHSLIFQTGRRANDALASSYLAATGEHGAKYRPPVIPVGDASFLTALDRAVASGVVGYGESVSDSLKDFYRDRYTNRLKPSGSSTPVRSVGFSEYSAALDMMLTHAATLRGMLLPYAATGLFAPTAGTTDYNGENTTRNAIRAGVELLLSANDIHHIAVVDGGVVDDYDTHDVPGGDILEAARIHGGGIWNVCNALFSKTGSILNNNILVLIHSEFGREQDGGGDGTEHHTRGYTNVVIRPGMSPFFIGAVDSSVVPPQAPAAAYTPWGLSCPSGGEAVAYTPTDVHAAVAGAAGIDPAQSSMYADQADLACGDLATAPTALLSL